MGLFDKIREPVFLKDDSEAKVQLKALEELRKEAVGELAEELDDEISKVKAGIFGEDSVRFELANSHIPMFVLHDLYLEHNGLSAQIDYLIITRKHQYVIECKNLYGNIEINNSGDFIRTVKYGKRTHKEGIYSPITQNRRHLELIRQIRFESKTNILTRALFENAFYDIYRSVVVLANPKTVLYDRYAKKEVKEQVIRADQLAEYIRKIDDATSATISEKDMEALANTFLGYHKPQQIDYAEKFRTALKEQREKTAEEEAAVMPEICEITENKEASQEAVKKEVTQEKEVVLCPKCGAPMIKRKASKGANAGKEFYGCPNFPKCRGIINIEPETK